MPENAPRNNERERLLQGPGRVVLCNVLEQTGTQCRKMFQHGRDCRNANAVCPLGWPLSAVRRLFVGLVYCRWTLRERNYFCPISELDKNGPPLYPTRGYLESRTNSKPPPLPEFDPRTGASHNSRAVTGPRCFIPGHFRAPHEQA